MKRKGLNFLLLLTSLLGYLEWGRNQHQFLFQSEVEVISKLLKEPLNVIHPLTILPIAAQLLLVFTLFQKKPGTLLTYLSIGGIGILLGLMFVIGILDLNLKIVLSTIPFLATALVTILFHRKHKNQQTST